MHSPILWQEPYLRAFSLNRPGECLCAKVLTGAEGSITMAKVNSLCFVLLSPNLPFPVVLLVFLVSLLVVIAAATWFTGRLESICDRLDLSAGILSMLKALKTNIPNYVASIVAITSSQLGIGLDIIIGSNIYNITIILNISTLVTSS